MKRSKRIELFEFSVEKVLKKYGKWFFKMCGYPVYQFDCYVPNGIACVCTNFFSKQSQNDSKWFGFKVSNIVFIFGFY